MSFRLYDVPEAEASRFVGFAGNRINRHSENRSDDVVTVALADAKARMLLIGQGQILVSMGNGIGNAFSALKKPPRCCPTRTGQSIWECRRTCRFWPL